MSLLDKLKAFAAARTGPAVPAATAIEAVFDTQDEGIVAKLQARADRVAEIEAPGEYAEVRRILGLDVIGDLTPEEVDAVSDEVVLAGAVNPDGTPFRLFPPQAAGFLAYRLAGGAFCPIGVGWGKTLLCLLIAHYAHTVEKIERIVYFVPKAAYTQLVDTDIALNRTRVRLDGLPFHFLGNKTAGERLAIAKSGKRGCYVMPYSLISTKTGRELLDAIAPGLMICDEGHRLKNKKKGARTRRWLDYLKEHPTVKVVVLSGTITKKSVKDYAHLLKGCLKNRTPLPVAEQMLVDWSVSIDTGADPSRAQSAPIRPVVKWARDYFPEQTFTEDVAGFRKAYRLRLTTAPGVVASADARIGVELVIRNTPVAETDSRPGWARCQELYDRVNLGWETPNGDAIAHAIHKFKWLVELSAGFYNELFWPTPQVLAERKKISVSDAAAMLVRARDHLSAEQEYQVLLREWLERHPRPHLDTPMLVGSNLKAHGAEQVSRIDRALGPALYEAWALVRRIDFPGRPDRDKRAVPVCDFKVAHAVAWAREVHAQKQGGIVFYYHQEVGTWIAEELQKAGLNPLHCPAGPKFDGIVADPKHKDRILVASISAHGEAKNLQHFSRMLVVQWPRDAGAAEQLIGRLHRNGQEAKQLVVDTCNTTTFDDLIFGACINDALYIHQTSTAQKMIYAEYVPRPTIFPPEVLRERGLDPRMLSREQRELLEATFGRAGVRDDDEERDEDDEEN